MNAGTIYLLHLSKPLKHAKHYLGFAADLESRLDQHVRGQGARLLQVAKEAGISFELARTWPGDRKRERRLKNRKESPRLCPMCSGAHALNLAKGE